MKTKTGPKWQSKSFGAFKGLNTITDKSILGTNTSDCLNVRHIVPGFILPSVFTGGGFGEPQQEAITSIRTITGYAQYNTSTATQGSTGTTKNIYDYRKSDTTTRKTLAYFSDGKIYEIPAATASGVNAGAWTSRLTGLDTTATTYGCFETFNNFCLFADGVDAMQAWDGAASAFANVVPTTWITKLATPTQTTATAAFSINGIGYLKTGSSASNIFSSYNIQTDVWATLSIQNILRLGASNAGSLLGNGYCGNGNDGTNNLNSWELYNTVTNTWTIKAPSAVSRVLGASFSTDSQLFNYGGSITSIASGSVNSIEYYAPISDAWTTKMAGGTAGDKRASFSLNSLGVFASGTNVSNSSMTTVDQYNVNTDSWSTLATIPTGATTVYGALSLNNGYVVSGSGTPFFYQYTFNTNAWTTLTANTNGAGTPLVNENNFLVMVSQTALTTQAYNTNPAPPVAFYLKSYRSSVFAARSSTYPSRVWYSTIGTHDIWNPNAYLDVAKDDGGWITGLAVSNTGQFLVVFKTTGIYAIDGTVFDPVQGNFSLRSISGIGCASHFSIAKSPVGKIYYLGVDARVHEFNGTNAIPVSDQITPTIQGYTGRSFEYCQAVYVPVFNEYRILFANAGTTAGKDRMFIYNEVTKQWFPVTPATKMDSIAIIQNPNANNGQVINNSLVLTGGTTTGLVYQWDKDLTGTDIYNMDGSAYQSYYTTAWLDMETPLRKLFRRAYVKAEQVGNWNLLIDAYADFSTSSAQTQQTFNLNNTDKRGRFDMGFHGQVCQLKFGMNTLNQWWDIADIDIFFELKGGGLWTASN